MAKSERNKKKEPKVEHKKVKVLDENSSCTEKRNQDPQMPFGIWWQLNSNAKAPVFAHALLWTAVGGFALDVLPVLGCVMIAFAAARILAHEKEILKIVATVVAAFAGVVVPLFFGVVDVLATALSAIGIAISLVVANFANKHRANVTTNYIIATLAALAMMGFWVVGAYLGGTIPAEAINEIMNQISRVLQTTGSLDMQAQFSAVFPLVKLLLPFGFFLLAGANVLGAHFGARLTRPATPQKMWRLECFDAPTWSVIALIVAVFLCTVGAASEVVLSIGVSTIAALRFIFMLQGFAVMMWWLGKYRTGCFLRFVILFLAIDLEASFFVLSILGLIDFFANFRKLNRARAAKERS